MSGGPLSNFFPDRWASRRVDWALSEVRRTVVPKQQFSGEVFLYSIPVVQQRGDGYKVDANEIGSAKLLVTGPTLLVSKLNPRKAVVVAARYRGLPTMCSSEFICLRPRRCDLGYARYLFLSEQVRQHLESLVKSATRSHQRVQPSDVTKLWLSWPDIDEQRFIASFLDRETGKIDTLIEKKRRLLDLLEEKRAALVTNAVISGLDPDIPMKDSGVEWLGEIPKHWEVRQTHHLCPPSRPIIYGIVLPGPDVPDGVPLIKGGDVDRGKLSPETLSRTEHEIDKKHARSRVAPGDIVYSIRGSFGEAAIVPDELDGANLTQDAARISPRPSIEPRWLSYALTSDPVRASAEAGALGATIKGVNIRDLRRLRIPTPPADEQVAIADFLDRENAIMDDIKSRVTHAISLLQEYRTALISAAVTGKIDGRDKIPA